MSTPEPQDERGRRRQQLVDRVLRFADLLQNLSERFEGAARALTLSGLIAALALDLVMRHAWDWSITVSILVGVVLALPALVIGWGWYVLSEAKRLPGRLLEWFGSAKSYADEVALRVQGQASEIRQPSRLSDLKSLGGLAFEITSMGMDASGLLSILGGALSVTNPIYLIVLTVSMGLIGLIDVIAMVAVLKALL